MKRKLRTERILKKLKENDAVELVTENLPEDFESFAKLGLVKDGTYKK